MKRILLVGIALTCFVGSNALAADLPPGKAAPSYVAAPVFNWTGVYAGINLGYGFGQEKSNFTNPFFTTNDSANVKGVNGGGQLGYNWQINNFVLGLETDFQASGQTGSNNLVTCPAASCGGITTTVTHNDKIKWFGSTRARLGLAANNWLFYGTGGVAYAGLSTNGTVSTIGLSAPVSNSPTRVGWTAGAGIENAITPNLTWRVEYLYADYGSFTTLAPAGFVGSANTKVTGNVVRLGVNFKM